mmetsp:Transcript_7464/g.6994  ORF Transcript_7464/g.6994 Transcript_7464/m.6994 type:complete len:211 (-) Transcript_7464:35-667(-)
MCAKCSSALEKKQNYASTKNGTACISSKGLNLVEFTCHKGHSWTVNIHRGYKNWCSVCIKLAKEQQRNKYKSQSNIRSQENAKKQKQVFEDAKTKCLVNSQTESSSQFGSVEELFSSEDNSFFPEAKIKAEAYFAQPEASKSCTFEQALCVYKVLEIDADRVRFILSGMSPDSKKVGYKKLVLNLHPDKNRHPLSNEAFLKASELFNSSF